MFDAKPIRKHTTTDAAGARVLLHQELMSNKRNNCASVPDGKRETNLPSTILALDSHPSCPKLFTGTLGFPEQEHSVDIPKPVARSNDYSDARKKDVAQ